MSKRLYQVISIIFDVVYTHDFFGNRQLERIQNIKKDQERFKNKF